MTLLFGGHVGFESWMERDHVMALDFDPTVVGIASQPFWLSWRDEAGKLNSHAPDFFARRADGTSVVVDCRPVERRKPRDAAKFEATERACAMVGWNYRLVGAPDPIVTANLRWLAGYRHPRHDLPDVREVCPGSCALATRTVGRGLISECPRRRTSRRPTPKPTWPLNHWTTPNSITLIDFGIASMSKSWTIVIVGRCGRDGVPMCSPESRYEAPDRL